MGSHSRDGGIHKWWNRGQKPTASQTSIIRSTRTHIRTRNLRQNRSSKEKPISTKTNKRVGWKTRVQKARDKCVLCNFFHEAKLVVNFDGLNWIDTKKTPASCKECINLVKILRSIIPWTDETKTRSDRGDERRVTIEIPFTLALNENILFCVDQILKNPTVQITTRTRGGELFGRWLTRNTQYLEK